MARNYAAEYAARNARSKAQYGVTYGKQRSLVAEGQKAGLKPGSVREGLSKVKAQGGNPGNVVKDLIQTKQKAQDAYQNNEEFDFDPELWAEFDLDDEWFWYH